MLRSSSKPPSNRTPVKDKNGRGSRRRSSSVARRVVVALKAPSCKCYGMSIGMACVAGTVGYLFPVSTWALYAIPSSGLVFIALSTIFEKHLAKSSIAREVMHKFSLPRFFSLAALTATVLLYFHLFASQGVTPAGGSPSGAPFNLHSLLQNAKNVMNQKNSPKFKSDRPYMKATTVVDILADHLFVYSCSYAILAFISALRGKSSAALSVPAVVYHAARIPALLKMLWSLREVAFPFLKFGFQDKNQFFFSVTYDGVDNVFEEALLQRYFIAVVVVVATVGWMSTAIKLSKSAYTTASTAYKNRSQKNKQL